jgi:hypothetical protein
MEVEYVSSLPLRPMRRWKYGWSCNLATHGRSVQMLRQTWFNLREPYVSLKNGVYWYVTPCGSYKNWLAFLPSVLQLLVTANGFPSSLTPSSLIMEALRSYEMSVLSRVTRRYIPEDGILHSHRREILKSYIALTDWIL